MSDITTTAEMCHEANRVLQKLSGEEVNPPWEDLSESLKRSAINGVVKSFSGETPEQLHKSWSESRLTDGWVWGPVKDMEKKIHPCLVEYEQLPSEQRLKDYIFKGVCDGMQKYLHSLAPLMSSYEKETPPYQVPSIGRIVHYHSYGTPGGEYLSEARSAIITEAVSSYGRDGTTFDLKSPHSYVSLAVLNPTGMFFNQKVRYSEEPKPGHWSWPTRV